MYTKYVIRLQSHRADSIVLVHNSKRPVSGLAKDSWRGLEIFRIFLLFNSVFLNTKLITQKTTENLKILTYCNTAKWVLGAKLVLKFNFLGQD